METIQLICTANQFTGFYMGATLAFNGLSELTSIRTMGFMIISVEIERGQLIGLLIEAKFGDDP